jgi:hypothetical protein
LLAFDVWIDGIRLARAGFEDWSVLSAHVTAVKERHGTRQRSGELEFSVGGLSQSDAEGPVYHLRWAKRDLAIGSKIVIDIIETDTPDPPIRRYRTDREVQQSPYSDEEIEQFEREELRRLKAKFEPDGDEPEVIT